MIYMILLVIMLILCLVLVIVHYRTRGNKKIIDALKLKNLTSEKVDKMTKKDILEYLNDKG